MGCPIWGGRSGQHVFKLGIGASEIFLHHLTNDAASSSLSLCPAPSAGGAVGQKLFYQFLQCSLSTPLCGGPHADAWGFQGQRQKLFSQRLTGWRGHLSSVIIGSDSINTVTKESPNSAGEHQETSGSSSSVYPREEVILGKEGGWRHQCCPVPYARSCARCGSSLAYLRVPFDKPIVS